MPASRSLWLTLLRSQRIPGDGLPSVSCLAWASAGTHSYERLFAAGKDGKVREVDFARCGWRNVCDSFGGAVWSIALNSAQDVLAVGCEDGGVRLFDLTSSSIEFDKQLAACGDRVLALAWHPVDQVLFAGTAAGDIIGWDVATATSTAANGGRSTVSGGTSDVRMTVENYGGKDTVVWALLVLKDYTVLSGDSLGHVQVWDARSGTLTQGFSLHRDDVLSLGMRPGDDDAPVVVCGGVDGKVSALRRVRDALRADGWSWVHIGSHRTHTHDVRAVAVSRVGIAVSGGLDTQLCALPAKAIGSVQPRRVPPFPAWGRVSVSTETRQFCVQHAHSVELWRATDPLEADEVRATFVSESQKPSGGKRTRAAGGRASRSSKRQRPEPGSGAQSGATSAARGATVRSKRHATGEADLVLSIEARGMKNLSASSLSPDGRWLALADTDSCRLFELANDSDSDFDSDDEDATTRTRPIPVDLPDALVLLGATKLCFSPDSRRLIAASTDSRVHVVDLPLEPADDSSDPQKRSTGAGAGGGDDGMRDSDSDGSSDDAGLDASTGSDGDADVDGSHASDESDSPRKVARLVQTFQTNRRRDGAGADDSALSSAASDFSDTDSDDSDGDAKRAKRARLSDEPAGDVHVNGGAGGGTSSRSVKTRPAFARPAPIATVVTLAVSADGQWLAAGNLRHEVSIFNLDSLKFHASAPPLEAPHTSLAFHPSSATLVITAADNKFILVNAATGRLSDWSLAYPT